MLAGDRLTPRIQASTAHPRGTGPGPTAHFSGEWTCGPDRRKSPGQPAGRGRQPSRAPRSGRRGAAPPGARPPVRRYPGHRGAKPRPPSAAPPTQQPRPRPFTRPATPRASPARTAKPAHLTRPLGPAPPPPPALSRSRRTPPPRAFPQGPARPRPAPPPGACAEGKTWLGSRQVC